MFLPGLRAQPQRGLGTEQQLGSSPETRPTHSANLALLQPLSACNMDSSPAGLGHIPQGSVAGAGSKGTPAWRLVGLDEFAELSVSASPPRRSLNAQKELFELEMQTPEQPCATPRLLGSVVLPANSASSAAAPANEARTSWSDWDGAEAAGTTLSFRGSSPQRHAQQATLPWVDRKSEDGAGRGPALDAWSDWAAAGQLTHEASPPDQAVQPVSAEQLHSQQLATCLLDL